MLAHPERPRTERDEDLIEEATLYLGDWYAAQHVMVALLKRIAGIG